MSDYEIAYDNWKDERLRIMREKLAVKTTDNLPLTLLGPVLRILGEMRGSPSGGVSTPDKNDFDRVAAHFKISLKPPPKK